MGNPRFPTTMVGGLPLSRMIMGTNSIIGVSHRSNARDLHIKGMHNEAGTVCEMIETYLSYGVNTIFGRIASTPFMLEAVRMAEQRTGNKVYIIELDTFATADTTAGRADAQAKISKCAAAGVDIYMPLHVTVERLLNRSTERIDRIEDYINMIRESGMVPGLSAHMPEVVTYADKNNYDVETYIQIYNASGFLMQTEIEIVHRIIWKAKKPIIIIKPMAAGHLNPFVGLTFVWNTIRPQDMVAVGCMTPGEVHECVEYSLAAIEHRRPIIKR